MSINSSQSGHLNCVIMLCAEVSLCLGPFAKRAAQKLLPSTFAKRSLSSLIIDKAYVDGEWLATERKFKVMNPFNESTIGLAADCDEAIAHRAITSASNAFATWKTTTVKERSKIMRKWFDLMIAEKQSLANLITLENGKPISQAEGEIQYAADFLDWFAEEGRRTYGITIPTPVKSKRMMTIKQPIGVVSMITPWNFPAAMITRKAAPALMAGCTVVVKPSEETPFSALALAELAEQAGVPKGVLNVIPCSRSNVASVGKLLSSHSSVAGVSFTGSTAIGKVLLQHAASTVKKVSLENGGNAVLLVFDSCDLDKAVAGAMACKFRYSGQTCISANRILVQSAIYDEFVTKLAEAVENQLVIGDGIQPQTAFGPLINEAAVSKMEFLASDAVAKGGKIITGGKRSAIGANIFEPTIISNASTSMKCMTSEIFGPIAPIFQFETEDTAVRIANETEYGLAGYLFSGDPGQCWRVAENLDCGIVGINESLVSSAECPFGGFKESGLGREGSINGMDEFMDVKYMCWGLNENLQTG